MAKSSSKGSSKGSSKKPKEDKILSELRGDIGTATSLRNEFLPTAPLAHYQDPRATETDNLLNMRLAYADPHNSSFAGLNSADSNNILQRMSNEADPNSTLYLGKSSADIEDVINRFKGGLEGYTSAENAAMREQSERGLDASAANQRYQRTRSNAAGRVRGAAAQAGMGQIDRERQASQRGLEQDLFIKNADEKYSRLQDYGALMRDVDATNYGRRDKAFGDFRDFQQQLEKTSFDRGQTAIKDYQDLLGGVKSEAFEYGKFNIGQDEKTQARDVGSSMGLLELLTNKRSEKKQNDLIDK